MEEDLKPSLEPQKWSCATAVSLWLHTPECALETEDARNMCLSEAGLASGFWRVESAVTSPNFSASFDYLISDVSFHLLTVFLNEGMVL